MTLIPDHEHIHPDPDTPDLDLDQQRTDSLLPCYLLPSPGGGQRHQPAVRCARPQRRRVGHRGRPRDRRAQRPGPVRVRQRAGLLPDPSGRAARPGGPGAAAARRRRRRRPPDSFGRGHQRACRCSGIRRAQAGHCCIGPKADLRTRPDPRPSVPSCSCRSCGKSDLSPCTSPGCSSSIPPCCCGPPS